MRDALPKVIEEFSLETLSPPVDLISLSRRWGVSSVETGPIASDAILLPGQSGYRIILKAASGQGGGPRQNFSFAHELGHLLLHQTGYKGIADLQAKHRDRSNGNEEERLCDQIAAEILMPRDAFEKDGQRLDWRLESLPAMGNLYRTSIAATASRMIQLMGETCLMGVWKPAYTDHDSHSLQYWLGSGQRYRVRNSKGLLTRRLSLIGRAASSREVETGVAPIDERARPRRIPVDAEAEAWAWGYGEHRKVMVFYYPERPLSNQIATLAEL